VESSVEELLERSNPDTSWRAFFGALVPILDGMAGLRDAVEESGDPAWRRGMEMVTARLDTLLASHGFERSARVGDIFDPARHRAGGARRTPGVPPGAIAEVVQEGWIHEGTVVRLATVIVCREDL
jgi:molecular chaperone GrpE